LRSKTPNLASPLFSETPMPYVLALVLISISHPGFSKPKQLKQQYQALKPIYKAPKIIHKKAAAVFQLINGTASLVRFSDKTLVMTNSHILGSKNCALNGCEVPAYFDTDKGNKHKQGPIKLHLVPFAEEIKADVSFFEILNAQIPESLVPLHFKKTSANELLGQKVNAVGYPRLAGKRWSQGIVVGKKNGWLRGSYFSLPGSSGSPILDDEGAIIGIHHRAFPKLDVMTPSAMLYSGIFTPTPRILEVLSDFRDANLRKEEYFVDTRKVTTLKNITKYNLAYLSAGTRPTIKSNQDFSEALIDRCLKHTNFETNSFINFRESTQYCMTLTPWLHCRSRKMHLICPSASTRKKIQRVFHRIISRHRNFDSFTFTPLLSAVSKLYYKKRIGDRKALQIASEVITRDDLKSNYKLIRSMIHLSHSQQDLTFNGLNLISEVINYKANQTYPYHLVPIVRSFILLRKKNLISEKAYHQVIHDLGRDDSIPLGARLTLEKSIGFQK